MKTTAHILSNGLQVILIDTESFPTVSALVMVGAGSRYERKDNNGIAHFFEHMAFKGSEKYKTSFEISSAIEGIGGVFNAFTSKDHTGYWIKATSEHTNTLLDVLSDMILHPRLDTEEINHEKGVIVEEINMYEDMPARKIGDIFEELLYAGSPLGMDIAGSKETVTSFNRKTFTDYIEELYHPNNAVVVLAGGLDKQVDYIAEIEKRFGGWKNKQTPAPIVNENVQKKAQLYVRTKKTEQVHICIGFRAFSLYDKRKYALQLVAAVLGGGMSSRLFMQVREKRGLCYYISTGRELYKDVGYMSTQAGIANDKKKIQEAINVIVDEHIKIAAGDITDVELKKAKELIKGRYLIGLEDSIHIASTAGTKYILENGMFDPAKTIKELEKVTKEEVVQVAKDIFVDQGLNCAIIGPLSERDIVLPALS